MAPMPLVRSHLRNKDDSDEERDINYSWTTAPHQPVVRRFSPLVVALVGLPARGKTVLAHKLQRFLSWKGHSVRVFSVSNYRRKHIELYNSHDLFRADNKEAYEIRKQSASEAMEDTSDWLKSHGDIAILDGTNVTEEARSRVNDYFVKKHGFRIMFVECICDDEYIISQNIKDILQFSKDYQEMSSEKALDDLLRKIEHYMDVYETINKKTEAQYSYIKFFNAGENVSMNKINGPGIGEILTFISNFRPQSKTFYFSRHGESENNVLGKIGGDADLSPRGKMYASALAKHMNDACIANLRVWTSHKVRTIQTAQHIVAPKEHLAALDELDAGVCEGLTYEEMQEKYPQEFAWRDQDKLRYRYPWGESYIDIMNRLEQVIMELERDENLLVISHQAVLRCILGYFLDKDLDELPYINVPLHTIIKLTTEGYKCRLEFIKLNVECVDTYRKQPKTISTSRTTEEALKTVPFHLEELNDLWKMMKEPPQTSDLIKQ
ncbi:6-phosphofructo-2-kinase/fructose-2,6-bisphosphatase [Nilaparvata lugens]|uniref:6-phosphofructo-2-kinase/fructose-2, 6-bisphosphatase n=1 Tax=Nilaparvata lugens TaxID=108931 RepID=UPI000B996D1D|nr:6-phosphofructo-2-kinase/fructose-2,6-bisphosphatase [Nilaparvata lugens]